MGLHPVVWLPLPKVAGKKGTGASRPSELAIKLHELCPVSFRVKVAGGVPGNRPRLTLVPLDPGLSFYRARRLVGNRNGRAQVLMPGGAKFGLAVAASS